MVRIIAHRGASRRHSENSQRAFAAAIATGADGLEVDLRASKDGKIYCFHDSSLARLTGTGGLLKRANSEVIDSLLLQGKEPILSFEDFLEEFAGKAELVLDIKTEGLERRILAIITPYLDSQRVVFSSFKAEILREIKSLNSSLTTALIVGPLRNIRLTLKFAESLKRRLARLGCSAVHLSRHIASERLITRLREDGFEVAVWTVDLPRSADKFVRAGANGIITNAPDVIIESLADKPDLAKDEKEVLK